MDKMQALLDAIHRLSYDKAFGILTRNAVEESVRGVTVFDVAFLDFDNVHGLNAVLGYDKVNLLFREVFSAMKSMYPNLIVGRWFSGDEIVVVAESDNITEVLAVLGVICKNHHLSFESMVFYNQKSLDIEV